MYSKIIGVGSYLPKKILTNHDIAKIVDTSDEWISSRTGIKQRHIAHENELTSDLATQAAQQAIQNANLKPTDIDCIIVATSTPDYVFPSTATIVQNKLGITTGFAFDVQAVCSGFIYGLSVADALIITKKAKNVLLIGAEVFSRILNWQDRNTCVLFGDGAGAVVITSTTQNPAQKPNQGIIGVELFSNGSHTQALKTTTGPSSGNTSAFITMNGAEVYKHAVVNLASTVDALLLKYNVSKDEIDYLVPHQANVRIIDSMGKKINLDDNKVIKTISMHGNTSAASIPLALHYGLSNNLIKPNSLILTEAMGAGFAWGGALIRL